MKMEITIHDKTYEWLGGIKGIGTPEEYIEKVVGDNLRALMFQQPTPALKSTLDAVEALCKPAAVKVGK